MHRSFLYYSLFKALTFHVYSMLSPVQILSSTPFVVFRWVLSRRQASSKRWQARHLKDRFRKEALVQGLKSRAAFKLLQVLLPNCLGLRFLSTLLY